MFALSRIERSSRRVAEVLRPRLVHRRDRDVDRAGDVPEAADVALEAAVLGRSAGVDEQHVRRAQQSTDVRRREPLAELRAWRERRRGRHDLAVRDRVAALDPAVPAALEDPRGLVAVGAQRPPDPRGEVGHGVVVQDDRRAVAHPGPAHHGPEPVGRREEQGIGALRDVDDVHAPVHVRGARHVAGGVQLAARAVRAPARVDDPQVGAAEVLGQPLGRGDELRARGTGQGGLRGGVGFGVRGPARMIGPWYPPSWPTRRRSRPSVR